MTTASSTERSATNGVRTALGLAGVLTLIAGILILVWPGQTAAVVTGILAIYTIAAGLVYAGLGIFSTEKGGWSRIGHIVLGLLFIVAGIVAFSNWPVTTALLAVFVAIMIGITWIIEGIVSLSTLGGCIVQGLDDHLRGHLDHRRNLPAVLAPLGCDRPMVASRHHVDRDGRC